MKVGNLSMCLLVAMLMVQPAAVMGDTVGTVFTYQGQLQEDDGSPVSDPTCDFTFELWADEVSADPGDLMGTESKLAVGMTDGLFTVTLDFGVDAFAGDARWLEIEARCPAGGGVYEPLSPRQELTPAPYAINADQVDGADAGDFVSQAEPDSVTTGMIVPQVVSSIDGVSNDGGNVDLVAGTGISLAPDDGADTITISSTGVSGVTAGDGLTGGGGGGSVTLNVGAGNGIDVSADSIAVDFPLHLSGSYGGYALEVITTSDSGIAIRGEAGQDVTIGSAIGVVGVAAGSNPSVGQRAGVFGTAIATSGVNAGVFGYTSSPSGYGVYFSGGLGGTGTKSFVQPHPNDPTKQINFVSLEGNESGTYFRGSSRLANGKAVIDVPEEFRLVTELEGLTVQVTPIGAEVVLWIESKNLDRIAIRGSQDVEFDYFVNGVRRGYADVQLIRENHAYVPEVRGVPYGTQYPEAVRQILVENGTLNPDYTPNEQTAAMLGRTLKEPNEQHYSSHGDAHAVGQLDSEHEARPAGEYPEHNKKGGTR